MDEHVIVTTEPPTSDSHAAFERWRQSGSKEDFESFWIIVERRCYNIALRVCGDSGEAEDAIHDAVCNLLKYGRGDVRIRNLTQWLAQVVRHCAHRKLGRRRFDELPDEVESGERDARVSSAVAGEQIEALKRALGRLSEKHRMAVELAHLSKWTALGVDLEVVKNNPELAESARNRTRTEIARELGINKSTFDSHIADALKKLQAILVAQGCALSIIDIQRMLELRPAVEPPTWLNERIKDAIHRSGGGISLRALIWTLVPTVMGIALTLIVIDAGRQGPSIVAESRVSARIASDKASSAVPSNDNARTLVAAGGRFNCNVAGRVFTTSSGTGERIPIANATITLMRRSASTVVARTRDDGSYEFGLSALEPPAIVHVSAGASLTEDYLRIGEGAASIAPGSKRLADVVLGPAGRMAGQIVDAAGGPVPGALAELVSPSEVKTFRGTTDVEGKFAIDHVAKGRYRLRIASGVVLREVGYVDMAAELRDAGLLELPPFRILEVHVSQNGGAALAGAEVSIAGAHPSTAVTDSLGRVNIAIPANREMRLQLRVRRPGTLRSVSAAAFVGANESSCDVQLPALRTVAFEVSDKQGRPIPGARASLRHSTITSCADSQGRIRFDLGDEMSIDEYTTFFVVAPDYATSVVEHHSRDDATHMVKVSVGGSIVGHAVDENKAPIVNAAVTADVEGEVIATAMTSDDGAFVLSCLPEYPVQINIRAQGFVPGVMGNVAGPGAGESVVANTITLERESEIALELDAREADPVRLYVRRVQYGSSGILSAVDISECTIEPGGVRTLSGFPIGYYEVRTMLDGTNGGPSVFIPLATFSLPRTARVSLNTRVSGTICGSIVPRDISPDLLSIIVVLPARNWFRVIDPASDGTYQSGSLESGDYSLVVGVRGYVSDTAAIVPDKSATLPERILATSQVLTHVRISGGEACRFDITEAIPFGRIPEPVISRLSSASDSHANGGVKIRPRTLTSEDGLGPNLVRSDISWNDLRTKAFPVGCYRIEVREEKVDFDIRSESHPK